MKIEILDKKGGGFTMKDKKSSKFGRLRAFFASFLVFLGLFSVVNGVFLNYSDVYAVNENGNTSNNEQNENTENNADSKNTDNEAKTESEEESTTVKSGGDCKDSLGSVGWLVCPVTEKIAEAVDFLYDKIEDILEIQPISTEDGTPIYEIWKYCLGITNIVFIIFLLVVIYSQITGMGISNYGIKKTLPKLIVMAIVVNLSFLICLLAVDVSNIVGNSLRGLFKSVEDAALASSALSGEAVNYSKIYSDTAGISVLAIAGAIGVFEYGLIWMLIPTVLGAIVAVVTGLITIALRQAIVILLVMISPLAMVASILPNTEKWFKKWKELFMKMLVFYPMFSLLFGASSLAGFAIIMSAKSGFGILLGVAVQIFPLFFSWKLMQMSGTILGDINTRMRGMAAKPLATNRAWADSHRLNKSANFIKDSTMPSARLMRYLNYRKGLRETDTANARKVLEGKTMERVQNRIGGGIAIGEMQTAQKHTSRYTRNAKLASNYGMIASNATANTGHLLSNYSDYFKDGRKDTILADQAKNAFLDSGRAALVGEIDHENDVNFMVDKLLTANKRNADGSPVDREAYNRYFKTVVGGEGEQRILGKLISQAAKIESQRRAETSLVYAKYGFNADNRQNFRSWISGYMVNNDGWAVDMNGKRLRDENGNYIETVRGEILTKAPEKMVLYDKKDEYGLYFDMKDQDGNIIARVHRGKGADGLNYDDSPFIKETLSNYDIPIADPINDLYGILSGTKAGDIVTPQGENEIGLSRYSTTIGRAMSNYKETASWAGPMFNTGVGNRHIKNSAQYAIWTLDSIKKTLKPGAFNTQNPASVEYLKTIMNPDNWDSIFTENEIASAMNINNEPFGGEEWEMGADGKPVLDENGEIKYHSVDNPNHEQRMNTIKRKLLFPAMKKILPAFDRLRTSNTADNQKPGTADMQYEFLKMVEDKWENNADIPFDPTLVNQDLPSEATSFRMRKHDKDGNLIYNRKRHNNTNRDAEFDGQNVLQALEEAYARSMIVDDLKNEVFRILNSKEEYARALDYFDEQCELNPNATMNEVQSWFDDLVTLMS